MSQGTKWGVVVVVIAAGWAFAAGDYQHGQTKEQKSSESSQQGTGGSGPASAAPAMDVEELQDDIAAYTNKKVTLVGEVEDRIDSRAFVLESGGLFDDEIVVITSPQTKGLKSQNLTDDSDVKVQGTVRAVSVVDISRELSWDLDPEVEVELEGTRYFLVADRIESREDED